MSGGGGGGTSVVVVVVAAAAAAAAVAASFVLLASVVAARRLAFYQDVPTTFHGWHCGSNTFCLSNHRPPWTILLAGSTL